MIKIFSSNDRIFTSNGEKILNPLKAKIHKADNDDYYIDIEAGLEYVDYLKQNNIIVAPTPTGEQAFRLNNPEKKKNKIIVKGYHVFYDSENYLIEDSYVVEKNCNDALDHLNSATSDTSPFTTISDITKIDSYRCVRTSLCEAIQTILNRWGGHLVRDNFNIGIRASIGQDNGVTIRYKKNLKEISCKEDWSNVVTKLLPVGKDGLMLEEKYITSDIQYGIPYTKTVSFNQEIEEDDFKDENGNLKEEEYQNALIEDLRNQANSYLQANSIPKINYTLKANLEKITDIGDTIEVIDERLGINIITNLISYEYDPIAKKYTELEFGNFKKKLSGLANNITSTTTEMVDNKLKAENEKLEIHLGEELAKSKETIMKALGSSFMIPYEDKILFVDKLPIEEAKNIIMINNRGIAFGNNGINGDFNSAWTIDGTLNMQNINVINLTADLIKGGTLKLGSNLNEYGTIEIYDESNVMIGVWDKKGIKMYGQDGSYVLLNNEVGFAGFDKNDNKIYWVDKDEFHMKKSVVEEEITLCNKVRFIPITIYDTDGNVVNDGIGLVATSS